MEEQPKIKVLGQEYTSEELEKLYLIVKDLAETNAYEWPYRGEWLQSRAAVLIQKSTR